MVRTLGVFTDVVWVQSLDRRRRIDTCAVLRAGMSEGGASLVLRAWHLQRCSFSRAQFVPEFLP